MTILKQKWFVYEAVGFAFQTLGYITDVGEIKLAGFIFISIGFIEYLWRQQ